MTGGSSPSGTLGFEVGVTGGSSPSGTLGFKVGVTSVSSPSGTWFWIYIKVSEGDEIIVTQTF